MRITFILIMSFMLSCANKESNNEEKQLGVIPITTTSERAKEVFKKARFLVQNGINSNPVEHYERAIGLDSSFVRMYNFISMYSPDDSIKRHNHELAKKYKHLASKEEQLLLDATEYRLKNPGDRNEEILFKLAKMCPNDVYLHHSICFLLFRKNPEAAITAGEHAVKLDSVYGSGYNILGYAYINNNELDKAEKAFDNFIRCEPQNGNAYDSKGDLMLRMGRYKAALEQKQKAYDLDSSFDWIPEEIIHIKATIDSLENK